MGVVAPGEKQQQQQQQQQQPVRLTAQWPIAELH